MKTMVLLRKTSIFLEKHRFYCIKQIFFTRLPKDLDTIKSIKEKKETFLQILLPLVVAENAKIKEDREYLLKILKENESVENRKWLNKKYKAYKVKNKNIDDLIEKIDIIPTSIALAQAAKESGWGTSRFALEGNAIYGQWTWNGDGIEPLEKTKNQNHKILKFPLLRASVKAYITNLNTHRGYKSFRVKRADLRKKNKNLAGIDLIHELENYAQTGKEYTRILEQIIKQNDLDELETVTIDDFKDSKELRL
jgi:Bax protein